MKKIRWGLIGAGRIAHQFARDMSFVPNGVLSAIGSRSKVAAEAFGAQYDIPHRFDDYQSLFECDEVDAVYIATPHNLHLAQATSAMAEGKAILCEKPLVTTPEECLEFQRAARHHDVYAMEAMWTYFLPAIRKAKSWVEAGRIGEVRRIQANFGYPIAYDPSLREYDRDLAGGCLLEMGIYPVALAWLFAERDPIDIQAVARTAPNGVEDDVTAIFDYGDMTAALSTSFRCKLHNWATIVGEEGLITIPDFWRAHECHLYHLETRTEHFQDGRESLGLNYQTVAVGEDLAMDRRQSTVMPLEVSLAFQRHMDQLRRHFEAVPS